MESRCMKCKGPKEMDPKEKVAMKNGTIMVKGKCKECGCGMCKIMKKVDADQVQI